MTGLLVLFLFFTALSLAAVRWGADTRQSGEWRWNRPADPDRATEPGPDSPGHGGSGRHRSGPRRSGPVGGRPGGPTDSAPAVVPSPRPAEGAPARRPVPAGRR